MKPNPFSNNPDTRTDVDTAKSKQLADDDDVKPVLLMAYSPVDNFLQTLVALPGDFTLRRCLGN
jgi:hypothetical protein